MDKHEQVLLSSVITHLEQAQKALHHVAETCNDTYGVMNYGKAKLQIQQARNTVEDIIKAGEQV